MLKSKSELMHAAKQMNYKPEILEKVYRLLDVLQQIMTVPYLKKRLVLKGGTALNLFYFDPLPRLSVDIDLNYIGSLERDVMLSDRTLISEAIDKILIQNRFDKYRSPSNHAGGKIIWFYPSLLGQRGGLEIDLNFMFRQPLYPIIDKAPKVLGYESLNSSILDIHELAAGKLSALFNRSVSRDWFDAHTLLSGNLIDFKKLRPIFVAYLAMTKINLASIDPKNVNFNLGELKNKLLPVLHQKGIDRSISGLNLWATKKINELRHALSHLIPLNAYEIEFIRKIREDGVIVPDLITDDPSLAQKIKSHPAIQWAASRR